MTFRTHCLQHYGKAAASIAGLKNEIAAETLD